MAKIIPFAAYRPAPSLAPEIASLPYDVYSREEAVQFVKDHPLSFLAIDRAETQFDPGVEISDPRVYEKARDMLQSAIREGRFIKDPSPCFYIYEMTMAGKTQNGIVACASVDDYLDKVIRKHENTRTDTQTDRIRHVDICNMHTGPIFLCYRNRAAIDSVVRKVKEGKPVEDFFSGDVRSRIWVINDPQTIAEIAGEFANVEALYIADGHHRCASAVRVALMRRAENPEYTGEEEYNYFLSVLFPENELSIMAYNRFISDLGGLSEQDLLQKLEQDFVISKEQGPVCPREKGEFGLFLRTGWYRLQLRDGRRKNDPVGTLDVSVLQDLVFGPILGITDPKGDDRIHFIGGIRGLHELERLVVQGNGGAAFSMYPTSIGELFAVADAGMLMPPKSTWFEPKLLSGLFLHGLE